MKIADGSFLLTPRHAIMDMRNNKRGNVLIQARVNFSQSETSSILRGGWGLNFELLLWGGGGGGREGGRRRVNRKDPSRVN